MIRTGVRGPLRLPDFLGIGPPRTATTWLERVLRGRVGLPEGVKETQFFVWRHRLGLEWYASHFRKCPPDLPVVEFAPTYFDSPEARDRIAHDLPECRIICTLRDPAERLYSHYRLWRKIGYTKSSFEHAAFRHRQLLDTARYADHLKGWFDRFGRERVLVLLHHDLLTDRKGFLDRVCDFIGIARFDVSKIEWADSRIHPAEQAPRSFRTARRAQYVRRKLQRYRLYRLTNLCEPIFEYCFSGGETFPPLDRAFADRIRASLRPQTEALEKLIGRDLSAWKNGTIEPAA
jgi:sulfotransferase family protein